MSGNSRKLKLVENGLDVLWLEAIETSQLNAVVTDLLDLLHCTLEIFFCIVADRVNLYAYR